ncbi:hypothetical protein G6O67_000211 [Ophiocordyceps sinensis]|uniref:Homeobox domain-containing protein n=1 Tax=Ophiocordyceps sinensis TaxID=72228 RepID=A0A8H4PYV4_9HYPO|nr:hypothetical protein G6O67_000211 [Ophiocordyceps sinensis]
MLITRICAPEYSPWQLHKYKPSPRRPDSPRMSDRYDVPIPLQPDWQGQYPCLAQHESDSSLPKSYADARRDSDKPRPSPSMVDVQAPQGVGVKKAQTSPTRLPCSGDSAGPGSARRLSPGKERSTCSDKVGGLGRVNSRNGPGRSARSSGPNHLRTVLAINTEGASEQKMGRREEDGADAATGEEGEIEVDDDDDVGAGEGDASRPQTVEERLAARRKMKRFRLTHQQTRFLMSEFAKQPHPDAAHRERLSREIPGLSPRQVQVWFQNRRAKIKRLTADDRDRVVRMRAVPDGFDNVQALHSPYGAVHGLTIPASPGDAVSAPYAGHMLRPLMVDVRRQEEAYMSTSTLTPSFGGIELGQSGGMSGPDVISPLSSVSSNKFDAESRLSTSSRTPGASICHQGNLDGVGQIGKPGLRQGQSLHMRESVGRSTPDSLQSPLRGSMSWKSDSFDYSHYQEAGAASSATDRHPSAYQAGHMGPAPGSGMGGFEHPYPAGSYSSLLASQARPRTRASSASFPLSIDLRIRDSYRHSGGTNPPPYACGQAAAPSTKSDDASMYSALHPAVPLSAPTSLPPTRAFNGRASAHQGHGSQVGSPMTAPHDFGRAFHVNLASQQTHGAMKDYFGTSPL